MTQKQKIWIAAAAVALVVLVVLMVWILWADKALELSLYTVTAEALPEEFDGFRIAQISDLHNAQMGENNQKLTAMLKSAKPDVIVITGDLIDSRRTQIPVALDFVRQAAAVAPCYYVTGNHEMRLEETPDFLKQLEQLGVTVLSNAVATVEKDGKSISLVGVDDPWGQEGGDAAYMEKQLQSLTQEVEGYTVVLSHRPELFDVYAQSGVDLVFSGHAHGGQIRLPLLGGLFAPNQGFFPEYDAGVYTQGNTHMVVSRGIGGSLFPVRVNNRPELVVVELQRP